MSKKILKEKMENLKSDTLRKLTEDMEEISAKGDFMDEDFSNRETMLQFRIKSREKFFLKKIQIVTKSQEIFSRLSTEQYYGRTGPQNSGNPWGLPVKPRGRNIYECLQASAAYQLICEQCS